MCKTDNKTINKYNNIYLVSISNFVDALIIYINIKSKKCEFLIILFTCEEYYAIKCQLIKIYLYIIRIFHNLQMYFSTIF